MKRDLRRGFTVLELIVASMILGLLMAAQFFIFRSGAGAWSKSDVQADLIRVAQTVSARVNRLVEPSTFQSASVDPAGNGVAFLSAVDASGRFSYDPVTNLPKWQKYVIFYYDSTSQVIAQREVGVVGLSQENIPQPIVSLGSGTETAYFSSGRPFAREVDSCRFSFTPDDQLLVEIIMQKTRYGKDTPEKQSVRVVSNFRN